MKKLVSIAFATALVAAVLGGCGNSNSSAIHCAYVTGPAGASGNEAAAAVGAGVDAYAAGTGKSTRVYAASADTPEGFKIQFDAAAQDGAKYVVCVGQEMEIPVYEAQKAHGKQKYLFFDGQPRQSESVEAQIGDNTECVEFHLGDMGFLAGYTAVTDGYRKLLFMTGEKNEVRTAYYEGLMSGASYAAREQNLAAGSVSFLVEYAGTDALSPLRMTDAMAQYDAGVDLIITDVPGIATAVAQAAERLDKRIGLIGFDGTNLSITVIFSVVADRTGVTDYLLSSFDESDKNFAGGQVKICGGRERAVKLAADYARLRTVSEASMAQVLDAMVNGTIPLPSDAGEEAGVSSSSISASEVTPVPANANSGLESQTARTADTSGGDAAAETTETAGQGETADGSGEGETAGTAEADGGDEAAGDEASYEDETAGDEASYEDETAGDEDEEAPPVEIEDGDEMA